MNGIPKREGIRTNYIGNRALTSELKCCIISNVGVYIPQWKKDLTLAPKWQDVDAIKCGRIDYDEFKNRYISKVLSQLNPTEVYEKYNGWYLLCCEKDNTYCHRTILVEWLNSSGYDAKEGLF